MFGDNYNIYELAKSTGTGFSGLLFQELHVFRFKFRESCMNLELASAEQMNARIASPERHARKIIAEYHQRSPTRS